MLIAPTEPPIFGELGGRSSTPELYGADFLFAGTHGMVGVQRKEIRDFIQSARNGRMWRELAKMSALHHPVLLVEGAWMWSQSGVSMVDPTVTRDWVRGVLWSVQEEGIWLVDSAGASDSVEVLRGLERWAKKAHHRLVLRRNPGPRWDEGSREWWVHFCQGFEGLGVERSCALVDHFEGRLPIKWTVTERELTKVEGIGKIMAHRLWDALETGETDDRDQDDTGAG